MKVMRCRHVFLLLQVLLIGWHHGWAQDISGGGFVGGADTTATVSLGSHDLGATKTLEIALNLWRSFVSREAARLAGNCDDYREDLNTSSAVYHELQSEEPNLPLRPSRILSSAETGLEPPIVEIGNVPMKQPRGSLTGKIVYCSGGHGWTCDVTSTSLWYTQRPLSYGIVEDYGNIDQLNLFADVLWRCGATIVPVRPLGNQPIERVIDNSNRSHVRFEGRWYNSRSPVYYGSVTDRIPYCFAIVSTTETAKAQFRPFLPKSDYYPVYCWARDGGDRVPQTYRIRHAAGLTEILVDHRRVGKGWVYLGEYYFNRGSEGYVEITNVVSDPALADGRHVVVADAIRFGNGMGDVNRGGGISGYPREEEASRYWVERMLPVGAPPVFDPWEATDQDSNVGSPPRMSAYMNRESEGSFYDRIYLGFHTNAAGGRGGVGLFEKDEDKRPTDQVEFARLVAQQLNEDMMTTRTFSWPAAWNTRNKLTDSHINFGEIRRDALNNEMCATIIEVAFHDDPLDARLIRDPRFRLVAAESAVKSILRFFKSKNALAADPEIPPSPPRFRRAVACTSSSVLLNWDPDNDNKQPTNVSYRIYYSTDGLAFGGGVDVGQTTAVLVTGLEPGRPHFFRLVTNSGAGESRPSLVLGARCSGVTTASRHLVVSAFTTFSEDVILSQTAPQGLGSPLRGGGEFVRIIPRKMNAGNYVAHWGKALAEAGVDFDSCDFSAAKNIDIAPTSYTSVMVALGKQSPSESPFDDAFLAKLDAFKNRGGSIVISGTNVVSCLRHEDRRVLGMRARQERPRVNWLPGATTESLHTRTLLGKKGTSFAGLEFALDVGEGDAYPVAGCDGLRHAKGQPLLTYGSTETNETALMWLPPDRRTGATILAGFPLECVQPARARSTVLSLLLDKMVKTRGTDSERLQQRTKKPRPTQRNR